MKIDVSDLMGVPFVNHGRDLNGLDCWGLIMIVMKRFGTTLPDFYVSCDDTLTSHTSMLSISDKFTNTTRQAGAVIGLHMDRDMPELVAHFGVCLDDRRFIHTLQKHGVIISDVHHPFFKNLIAGYYKWILPNDNSRSN